MKISEILWQAANRHLKVEMASCFAVMASEGNRNAWVEYRGRKEFPDWFAEHSKTGKFLNSLGLPRSFNPFDDVKGNWEIVQAYRYAWLMFASMYAEELGI